MTVEGTLEYKHEVCLTARIGIGSLTNDDQWTER